MIWEKKANREIKTTFSPKNNWKTIPVKRPHHFIETQVYLSGCVSFSVISLVLNFRRGSPEDTQFVNILRI